MVYKYSTTAEILYGIMLYMYCWFLWWLFITVISVYHVWSIGGGWVGADGNGQKHPHRDKQQCCDITSAHKLPQSTLQNESHHTPSNLINAHQWPHAPCSEPLFYRVGKRPSMKADLAIYSLTTKKYFKWHQEFIIRNYNYHELLIIQREAPIINLISRYQAFTAQNLVLLYIKK